MITLRTAQPARDPRPLAVAKRLAYVIVGRPDLDAAQDFLREFGLRIATRERDLLYAQSTDGTAYCYRVELTPKPRFIGFGVEVESRDELERLARLPGSSGISSSSHPGGGELVRLTDPAGMVVEACWGRAGVPAAGHREPLALHRSDAVSRINAGQRPQIEPPEVLRLGHVALEVSRFQRTCAWYTSNLGMVPSDVQLFPDGSPAVVFLRLDLGSVPADHHTLALAQSFRDGLAHMAFELVDVDAVGMGHRLLEEAGYAHAWGVGRHVLGSQVFDYWCDPWDDKHEHYCDGDMFTADTPMGISPVSRTAMAQWGPTMPRSFVRPPLRLRTALELLRSLRGNEDLGPRRLLDLASLLR